MKKIFYLEPYVYKQIEEDNFLLYNTLTGKFRFMKNEEELLFLKKMLPNQHLILYDELSKPTNDFINFLKSNFFGDIRQSVDDSHYQHSPNIVSALDEQDYRKKKFSDYISDLTLYINGECLQECNLCNSAYKQFTFCTKLEKSELEFSEIEDILSSFSPEYLKSININGGNILFHSEFETIVNFLNSYPIKTNYFINSINLSAENITKLLSIGSNSVIVILFSNVPSEDELSDTISLVTKTKAQFKFIFVLQNNKDVKSLGFLNFSGINYELVPYISSNNHNFIKKNVFLTKKDIFSVPKLSYKQILEKNKFNLLLWGKTYILNNKDLYANLNSEKIDSAFSAKVSDKIFEIVKEQKDVWFLTRNSVEPCKNCVYRIFCPPISNYELFTKRYNFCSVKTNSKI